MPPPDRRSRARRVGRRRPGPAARRRLAISHDVPQYPTSKTLVRRLRATSARPLRCGGRLQLIAVIEDPAVIERILRHLGLPTDIPEARPARPPPMPFLLDGLATAGGDDQILVDTRS